MRHPPLPKPAHNRRHFRPPRPLSNARPHRPLLLTAPVQGASLPHDPTPRNRRAPVGPVTLAPRRYPCYPSSFRLGSSYPREWCGLIGRQDRASGSRPVGSVGALMRDHHDTWCRGVSFCFSPRSRLLGGWTLTTMTLLSWGGFLLFILVLLAIDLGLFHRKAHTVSTREALGWTVAWIEPRPALRRWPLGAQWRRAGARIRHRLSDRVRAQYG